MRVRLVSILGALMIAGPAAGDVHAELRQVPKIYNGLFAVAVANEIRKECDAIAPRIIRAWRFVRDLQAHAQELGYSEAETEDFVTSKQEQARMQEHVDRYLAENGVVEDDPETYCALGRAEIARGSQAGNLLSAR